MYTDIVLVVIVVGMSITNVQMVPYIAGLIYFFYDGIGDISFVTLIWNQSFQLWRVNCQ